MERDSRLEKVESKFWVFVATTNKNIFKMFSLIGIGERAGSGIENIYKVWDEVSFRKSEIIESVQPD